MKLAQVSASEHRCIFGLRKVDGATAAALADRPTISGDQGENQPMLTVTALDHLVINVRDVDVTAAWYERVLGMVREQFDPGPGKPPRTLLKFGAQKINVRPIGTSKIEWFTADHEAAGGNDLCFLTEQRPDAVIAHLTACGVAIEEGPVRKSGARGTLMSVYCRDPDGSLIEIASYLK
jgi:catechol 2,3-dioxygenase-like lactoylglutathione lyase family enzyme